MSDSTMTENEELYDTFCPEFPLSVMLPSKYKDVDITTMFPDFKRGKVILITMI